MSFEGSAIISFPASKRARVNAQGFCQFLLGYARKATIVDYPVPSKPPCSPPPLPPPPISCTSGFIIKGKINSDELVPFLREIHRKLILWSGPKTVYDRYITEDLPYGLVPMVELGRKLRVSTPLMEAIVNIGSVVCHENFWETGRTLETLGLAGLNKEEILKLVEG